MCGPIHRGPERDCGFLEPLVASCLIGVVKALTSSITSPLTKGLQTTSERIDHGHHSWLAFSFSWFSISSSEGTEITANELTGEFTSLGSALALVFFSVDRGVAFLLLANSRIFSSEVSVSVVDDIGGAVEACAFELNGLSLTSHWLRGTPSARPNFSNLSWYSANVMLSAKGVGMPICSIFPLISMIFPFTLSAVISSGLNLLSSSPIASFRICGSGPICLVFPWPGLFTVYRTLMPHRVQAAQTANLLLRTLPSTCFPKHGKPLTLKSSMAAGRRLLLILNLTVLELLKPLSQLLQLLWQLRHCIIISLHHANMSFTRKITKSVTELQLNVWTLQHPQGIEVETGLDFHRDCSHIDRQMTWRQTFHHDGIHSLPLWLRIFCSDCCLLLIRGKQKHTVRIG